MKIIDVNLLDTKYIHTRVVEWTGVHTLGLLIPLCRDVTWSSVSTSEDADRVSSWSHSVNGVNSETEV